MMMSRVFPRRYPWLSASGDTTTYAADKLVQRSKSWLWSTLSKRREWSVSSLPLPSSRSFIVHPYHPFRASSSIMSSTSSLAFASPSSPSSPSSSSLPSVLSIVRNNSIRRRYDGPRFPVHLSAGCTMYFSSFRGSPRPNHHRQYHQKNNDGTNDNMQYYDETYISGHQSTSSSTTRKKEKYILICGDGDLSFGASLAVKLANGKTKMTKEQGGITDDDGSDGDVRLIVSVLDSETQHSKVFRDSFINVETIRNHGHEVIFGVDATNLSHYFNIPEERQQQQPHNHTNLLAPTNNSTRTHRKRSFDRIQFNFPHWKGKANIRKNRELIQNFFASSKRHLSPGGEIHIALTADQGGMYSKTIQEWKQSWMPARYAAEHGLLLSRVLPFRPTYNLSAYQWKDLAFNPGTSPNMYIFSDFLKYENVEKDGGGNNTSAMKIPRAIQLYSFFNILIALPPPLPYDDTNAEDHFHETVPPSTASPSTYDDDSHMNNTNDSWTSDEILDQEFLQNYFESHVPHGIRIESKLDRIFDDKDMHRRNDNGRKDDGDGNDTVDDPKKVFDDVDDRRYAAYRIVLYGEGRPLTRHDADAFQRRMAGNLRISLRGNRRDRWNASNVNPTSILGSIRGNKS